MRTLKIEEQTQDDIREYLQKTAMTLENQSELEKFLTGLSSSTCRLINR